MQLLDSLVIATFRIILKNISISFRAQLSLELRPQFVIISIAFVNNQT